MVFNYKNTIYNTGRKIASCNILLEQCQSRYLVVFQSSKTYIFAFSKYRQKYFYEYIRGSKFWV